MKRCFILLPLMLFCLISCRERTNMFDIGSDDFVAPPPIALAWPSDAFYDSVGNLIGVQIQVDFAEGFRKDLTLTHRFYQGVTERLEFTTDVSAGATSYAVDVYGPYEVGEYCLKIYFGEFPIGACKFTVEQGADKLIVRGVSYYETVPLMVDKWYAIVH